MPDSVLNYYTFPDNNANRVSIPITKSAFPLASVDTTVNPNSRVIIRITAGWEAVKYGQYINRSDVLFKLWRGSPLTGNLICSAMDSAEPNVDRNKVTTFSQIDTDFSTSEKITYTVTAEAPLDGSQINIIGGLTVTVLLM